MRRRLAVVVVLHHSRADLALTSRSPLLYYSKYKKLIDQTIDYDVCTGALAGCPTCTHTPMHPCVRACMAGVRVQELGDRRVRGHDRTPNNMAPALQGCVLSPPAVVVIHPPRATAHHRQLATTCLATASSPFSASIISSSPGNSY
jgi:hypothetical protein